MKQKIPPTVLAMNADTGNRVGHGQDNLVHELVLPEFAEQLTATGDWVVKVSHQSKAAEHKRDWDIDPTEAAISGTKYKANKYEILKHFLGDYVPESSFFVSDVQEPNGKVRPAEITIQKRVPNFTMDDLTEDQKNDPVLHKNITNLMDRLQYMYSILGEVNARTADSVVLDAKLDLGGISDFVRAQDFGHHFTEEEAAKTAHRKGSPNLLVDPESLDIYTIDYDQGDWREGMAEARDFAFELDEKRTTRAREVAKSALMGTYGRRSTDVTH